MTSIRWVALVTTLTLGLASAALAADSKAAKPAKKPADTHAASSVKPMPAQAATTSNPAAPVDSLVTLEKAVAKDSTKFDNLYRLGAMYIDRDRSTEALQVLHRALRIKPDHVGVNVNLGAAYDAAGNPDAAQTYYRKALTLAPGDPVATCRLATSLYAKTQYQESMKLLRDLIAREPNTSCAYFALGVAFADAGIYRDAIRMWKKVVELDPSSPEAMSAKESVDVLEKFIKGQ